jgi:hypothetical protein
MIRTLDANYLSTFHLPRPASGPAPFHLVRPLGLGLRDWWRTERLRQTTTHHRQTAQTNGEKRKSGGFWNGHGNIISSHKTAPVA